jgi:two-component system LytT family response regulator
VFLDVQMPEVSGFDVLRALPAEIWPAVIFVTAHDQHALEAFEVHALDYLLKPFTQERLLEAVGRARHLIQARDMSAMRHQLTEWLKSSKPEPEYLSRIAVRTGSQTLFIKVEDVDYIEAAANYAVLHTRAGNHVLRETLTNLESQLPPRLFLRISRSVIVNLERVKGVQSGSRDDYLIVLEDGRQLLLTRAVRDVQERIKYTGDSSR